MSDAQTFRFATEMEVSDSPFPDDARYQRVSGPDGTPLALAGGMGIVYRARDTLLGIDVAIKRMRRYLPWDADAQKRFIKEARTQIRLNHPHIVRLYTINEDHCGPWIVLEWVEGLSLQTLSEGGTRPTVEDAVTWTLQIAGALHYAHSMGLVHRDVKPGNILLRSSDRQPLLTDFGLVVDRRLSQSVSGVSAPGIIVGTIDFMAPEQAAGSTALDHRADQWALGATLGWLLTGKTMRVLRERDLPKHLRDVVLQATEEHPQDRFRDLQEFAAALRRVMEDRSAPVPAAKGVSGPDEPPSPAPGSRWADLVREIQEKVSQQHALARKLLAGQRYAEAAAALEDIPDQQRHLRDDQLYRECVSLREQVQSLDFEIDSAVTAMRFDGLEEKVLQLQKLQTWRKDLEDLLKTLPTASAAGSAPLSAPFDEQTATAAQTALAKALKQPEIWTNSVGMRFRPIPAGTFSRVTITRPFWLGAYQVTQSQWQKVMGTTPWKGQSYVHEGSDVAASCISWNDATEFCRRLSKAEQRRYRLPTEAEWEWACRAGTTTLYSFGDAEGALGEHAWFSGNAWDRNEKYAHRTGLKRSNPFGLFDVHGNVWEWCSDWHGRIDFINTPTTDPQGASVGSARVLRGGSWDGLPTALRSSFRFCGNPADRDGYTGCRVLVELW